MHQHHRRVTTPEGNGSGHIVLDAPPHIVIGVLEPLRAELLKCLVEGAGTLVLDCSATTYADATGLAMLLHVQREASERGAEFVLSHASPALRELLELTALTGLLLRP